MKTEEIPHTITLIISAFTSCNLNCNVSDEGNNAMSLAILPGLPNPHLPCSASPSPLLQFD